MKDEKEKSPQRNNLHPSNFNLILKRLPHRSPFLMVDRVLDMVPGQRARGIKLITVNEELLQGVNPAYPCWPAGFFIEALAQLAAVTAADDKGPASGRGLLVQVKNLEVQRIPLPGDVLLLEVERVKGFGALHQFEGRAFIAGTKVAQAELVFTLTAGV